MSTTRLFLGITFALCACSDATHDEGSVPDPSCTPLIDSGCSPCTPGSSATTGGCPTASYTCTDAGTWVFSGEVACHFPEAGSQDN